LGRGQLPQTLLTIPDSLPAEQVEPDGEDPDTLQLFDGIGQYCVAHQWSVALQVALIDPDDAHWCAGT
jgi:hypothetical protein